MHSESEVLFYHNAAEYWNEALPLGNGKIGAMVYGKTVRERIDLNYDELWSGFPRKKEDGYIGDALQKAAALVREGKACEAEAYLAQYVGKDDVEAFLPFGTLYLDFDHKDVSDYERSLDLADALMRVTYRANGAEYQREVFVSAPDRAMIVRLACSEKKLSFAASFASPMRYRVSQESGKLLFDGECFANSHYNRTKRADRNFYYSEKNGERGILYRGILGVQSDGRVRVSDKRITVENASEAVLIFTAESSFNGYDKHPFTEGKEYQTLCDHYFAQASQKSYAALKDGHIADYCSLYQQSSFSLGFGKTDTPTDERLYRLAESGETDKGLYGLFFNYAKYLTVAGSREGSEPMNLQGIWNHTPDPMWASDYTTNINTEMNYFPTLTLGLFSCYEPLLRLVKELSVSGREVAQNMYGARGFTAHHNTDLWRKATPASGKIRWTYFPQAAAWLVSAGYFYYKYIDNKTALQKEYLPIMKEAAKFLLDLLRETEDGALIASPATSPENEYKTEQGPSALSYTTAMAMDITAQLFDDLLDAAEKCDDRDETVKEVKAARPRLLSPRIKSSGELMEWYEENELTDPHHRHISHLYALYPARLIDPRRDKALAHACMRSLDARGDEGTGWSLAWKICCRARLLDGERAEKLLRMQLRPVAADVFDCTMRGGTYPNFLDAHPPFQIDGNFGAAAGICEMLLQWDDDNIYLLPAIPESWKKEGSFRLFTPHGEIACAWQNGVLTALDRDGLRRAVDLWAFGRKIKLC